MPTGKKHYKVEQDEDGSDTYWAVECRCMLGEDHSADPDDPWGEALSEDDAEDIWLSSGMDEDYDFRP